MASLTRSQSLRTPTSTSISHRVPDDPDQAVLEDPFGGVGIELRLQNDGDDDHADSQCHGREAPDQIALDVVAVQAEDRCRDARCRGRCQGAAPEEGIQALPAVHGAHEAARRAAAAVVHGDRVLSAVRYKAHLAARQAAQLRRESRARPALTDEDDEDDDDDGGDGPPETGFAHIDANHGSAGVSDPRETAVRVGRPPDEGILDTDTNPDAGGLTRERHYSPSGSPAPTPPPKPAATAAAAAKSLARPAPRTAPRPAPKPAALKTSASSQYLRTSTTPSTPSRSPVRSPANVPPSAEISKLQAELLQLYLLHDEAAATDAAWRASAKAKLGERFLRIREENQEAADKERAATERVNVLALSRWGAGGSTSLDERIQALEAIVSGCWALSDPGGRHAAVVARFERWVDGVAAVQEARTRPEAALGNEDVLFVGELDAAWRQEREDLMQRLDAWKKQLDEIDDLDRRHGHGHGHGHGIDATRGDVDDGRNTEHGDCGSSGSAARDERSGLERMLEGARSLIGDMAAELDMMGVIEREALQQEEDWIETMNCQDDDGALRAGPAWRV
ncbi:hypothetical protein ESCO_005985 [Escovopsis weberi]|uniref:Uncharacterized protein n=1 Tax=Escovopsis weberi TaxID=150374 RepID=A0A0N0RSZ4_ESCWE|nr:hypothetical protein ESCO_005985 [Escovopsis weberi]